jgi:hypothetical protein
MAIVVQPYCHNASVCYYLLRRCTGLETMLIQKLPQPASDGRTHSGLNDGGNAIIVVGNQLVIVAARSRLGIQNHTVLRGTSTEHIGKR